MMSQHLALCQSGWSAYRPARLRFGAREPNHAVAFRCDDLLPERMRFRYRITDRLEALLLQNPAPALGRQAGATGYAHIRVFVEPPSFKKPEGQMGEQALAADLIEQQH